MPTRLPSKNDPTKVDPRLILNAGQPFVDEYIDGKGRTTLYNRSSEITDSPDRLAWQHRKYTNIRGTEMGVAPNGWNESSNCNFYIISLADIYLLYAELMADEAPATVSVPTRRRTTRKPHTDLSLGKETRVMCNLSPAYLPLPTTVDTR